MAYGIWHHHTRPSEKEKEKEMKTLVLQSISVSSRCRTSSLRVFFTLHRAILWPNLLSFYTPVIMSERQNWWKQKMYPRKRLTILPQLEFPNSGINCAEVQVETSIKSHRCSCWSKGVKIGGSRLWITLALLVSSILILTDAFFVLASCVCVCGYIHHIVLW